jgi:alpha-ketoglutarate-dependent taurine dioxygenase
LTGIKPGHTFSRRIAFGPFEIEVFIMNSLRTDKTMLKKLPKIERNAVSVSQMSLIKTCDLRPGCDLPIVIEPGVNDVDLPGWVSDNKDFISSKLLKHGGILFRGFNLGTRVDFDRFLSSYSAQLMNYMEGATPRTELGGKVYTSTEYPSDQSIALHNELTYVTTWPTKIWFFCVTPAEQGGETPIADVRRVYERISERTLQRFQQKGWMLVRNYGEDLSLGWESAFRTTDRQEVERYCLSANIAYEWKDGHRLKTRQVRPAIARHPMTGEMLWFNHVAFWHVASLDEEVRLAIESMFEPGDLPYNTYYGDGELIDKEIIAELREAYRQETVTFQWQKGDLLMLDNMLVAHGRNPYKGARRVLVAMADPCSNRGV